MKRFIVATSLAVALALGNSGKADAQIVFNHTVPVPNGSGLMTGNSFVMPNGFNNSMFFPSPRGVMIQPSFRPSGFNQFNGMGFRNNCFMPNQFSQPMMFGTPCGGSGMNGWHMGHWHR